MLDALEAERELHDRHRNLVVAATGTGKTVIAALDYRHLVAEGRAAPSLLFVAHRREILEQSLRTYREVLADGDFGELYVGGARPERWNHVFASVQSLTPYGVDNFPRDAYEVVVIDEFHHAEARTYRRILEHLQPQGAPGLTATPERADGTDVRTFFDGRTAAELRLWDALDADLLARSTTSVSPTARTFARSPGTEADMTRRSSPTSTPVTTPAPRSCSTQLRDKIGDVRAMRALGFCVSVAHADYMARVFNEAGVPARAVSGKTPRARTRGSAASTCERQTSTSSSRSTSSTKASTFPTSTPCSSYGRPRARPSSCSNSAEACVVPRTRPY